MKMNFQLKSTARLAYTLLCSALLAIVIPAGPNSAGQSANQTRPLVRQIQRWLDYRFDATAPLGDAKNPAVIVPLEMFQAAKLLGSWPGAKQVGDTMFIPAAELQKAINDPLVRALLSPILNQKSNIKSFDGFSAVDLTGLVSNLPSELSEPVDATARQLTGENPLANEKLLRDGDIVLGSHVVNFMTWGRYNHVAIVTDAAHGKLIESTAKLFTDKPGVRTTDWKTFASPYAHVGIVRLRGATAEQLARVIRWAQAREGTSYRWPIVQGLNKMDQSRFYCSQLVWLAYKEALDIDLDFDGGDLVFPDDLYYSEKYVDKIVP
jgi:uncharacterized protein YycO